jgi:alkyl sulfatase BDS1-like metallo-beta-lactamase superfamily hydrolase
MGAISKRVGQRLFGDPRIDAPAPGVHVARGFDLGNVIKLASAEGPVVVDTASSRASAARARDALAAVSPGEARYVVYTHSHNDHTSGAESLVTDATQELIAHAATTELTERDHGCLGNWTSRHRSHQRGRPFDPPFDDRGYVEPTLTFDRELDIEVGELTLHLEHTEGETRDHLLVWVPETRVLLCGDLIYPAFPNLSTPAVGPRPILGWLRSLDRFRELAPDHLVPSHGPPVSGGEAVRDVITAYRDAIQYVWDESLRAIDAGIEVHAAARAIELPEHLRAHPWLREVYGTVNWAVRAVYDVITGWYDLSPASLDPSPSAHRHAALVDAASPQALIDRAREALADDDAQLALELTDPLLSVEPTHQAANEIQIDACEVLRDRSTSLNQRGFYHAGIVRARGRLDGGAVITDGLSVLRRPQRHDGS